MCKTLRIMSISIIICVSISETLMAYDIPSRQIDLKPYLNVMFPSDFEEKKGFLMQKPYNHC